MPAIFSGMLVIPDDDDRNVPFQQTTDLVEKLRAQNIALKLVIPNDMLRNEAVGCRAIS